ncbi:MAG: TonB-dependent siderophore receptor [Vicinamibacteraceae bacterium]
MKTRPTSRRSSSRARSSSRRWATVGVLAASAALAGRVSAASIQLPPEFRARVVEPLSVAWLRDERHHASDVTIGPAVVRADDQLPAATRFDIPPGPLSAVIKAFEAVTGYTVTMTEPALGDLPSPGVAGVTTVDKAIAAILQGTGVNARETGLRQFTLALGGVSESLEVTATTRVGSVRYARPVSETPQTIQVIPRQVMEAQGVTTLSEALRNVPGISLQAGEGGGASSTTGDMFNLRGFSANNSLFVDGVRDDGLIARDVFNLEQVEVFLGPTGTDVGRGNAAGYVNMTTKTPAVQTRYAGMATLGTADQRRVSIDLNQAAPVGKPGSWLAGTALRLNALKQDSGVPGRDEVRLRSQAVAPSLALGLGTHTRIAAGGQFTEQDNVPDYGIPGGAWQESRLAPTTVQSPQPVDQSNFYGTPAADYDRVSQDSTFARLEHDLRPTLQLKHQFRHNKAHRAALISTVQNPAAYDAVTGQVTVARQGNERENRITANQTSVSTVGRTGQASHALTGTLEFTRESQFTPTLAGFGTRSTADIYHPDVNTPVAGVDVTRTGAFSDGQADTVALSVFDAIDIGPRLQLTGGLRVERYDATFLARDAAGVATTDVDVADTLVSGKIGLLYKLTDQGNAYVSFGNTKTPPGTANFALSAQANNQNNPNTDPQISRNLEVGTKWNFYGSRLSLTGAAFRTKNENVIFSVDATAVPPVFNQDDAQEVTGVSLGIAGRVVRAWDVTANLAYLDSENLSQNAANNGRRLTLAPVFSGSVWTTYTTPWRLSVGGGVRFIGDVFINAGNTIQAPGYALVDAMATYDVSRHVSLRLNVYNLTDESYVRNVNNNGGRYNPGYPRTATLTASFGF